ncbi:MAG: DUF4270 family protein [Flavobacteriales bacterium]|nr:DUF4270 family protein [Flavobacteriales bacterium]MBL6873579.1 DUF4270 family protein [Flavobacteriales bacterium]
MKHLFLFSLVTLLIASCTDPQVIGLEVQPESDKISISSLDDSNPFSLTTKSADSVRTDEPLVALLGNYESSNFKDVSASFSTQLLLSQNAVDFGSNPVLDSAVLNLVYSSYYGDTTIEMGIKIEQLDEPIDFDSSYYSNEVLTASPFSTPLEYSFLPRPNTRVFAEGDTVGQRSLKINVNQIGQMILDAGTDNLVDNLAFLSFFKGLKISTSDNISSSILYFNLKDAGSKLTIYYNDTLSYDLLIGSSAARINHFETEENIDLDNLYGVQSMGGTELHLTFNNLSSLRQELENKVINQALISFSAENNSDLNPSHPSLSLVRMDSTGTTYFLSDILEGQAHFGGVLENNQYVFNISKYMLDLINGTYTDSTLVLVSAGEAVNANRTEISQDVDINIIYTEF